MAKKVKIVSPAAGKVLALSATNDEVFSTGMMGEGFGLEPVSEKVVAPVSGKITMVADSKHAVGITTKEGLEVLVHMGIDTVGLNGEPFDLAIQDGQEVKAGQALATMSLENIKLAGLETTIMVIITNSSDKLEGLILKKVKLKLVKKLQQPTLKQLPRKMAS